MSLFGVDIDACTMSDAVERVWQLVDCQSDSCEYVVTPNVDHAVMLEGQPELRASYRDAALVLADGWPIVTASRWLGQPLPERVAGSDLVPALFADPRRKPTVFLFGAAPGVAARAAGNIQRRWPNVSIVGTYSPPLGFESDEAENEAALKRIGDANPQLLVIGLGAPKQELWVYRNRHRIPANVALCVGATIDFLAGHRRRAPLWMREAHVEWLFRLASEPRRLAGRYGRDAIVFPRLVWREWRRAKGR